MPCSIVKIEFIIHRGGCNIPGPLPQVIPPSKKVKSYSGPNNTIRDPSCFFSISPEDPIPCSARTLMAINMTNYSKVTGKEVVSTEGSSNSGVRIYQKGSSRVTVINDLLNSMGIIRKWHMLTWYNNTYSQARLCRHTFPLPKQWVWVYIGMYLEGQSATPVRTSGHAQACHLPKP